MQSAPVASPPRILIAASEDQTLTRAAEANGCVVSRAPTGALAVDLAHAVRPDVIVLDESLPDMSGADTCRILRSDPLVGRSVPILILVSERPSPEQRVRALRAGAWDFLRVPAPGDEAITALRTYVEAKRGIDAVLGVTLVDAPEGLHSRSSFVRSARPLGALMSRLHGALACVVFELDHTPPDPDVGVFIARAVRASDVVGALTATRFGVLAPGNDHFGAVSLAVRVGAAVTHALEERATQRRIPAPASRMLAGYDAESNVTYAPVDPVLLIARAMAAVRNGEPEPGRLWVRRHVQGLGSDGDAPRPPRAAAQAGATATTRVGAPELRTQRK